MAKAKSLSPTSLRLAADTDDVVGAVMKSTGWSASQVINWAIRFLATGEREDFPAMAKLLAERGQATAIKKIDDEAEILRKRVRADARAEAEKQMASSKKVVKK